MSHLSSKDEKAKVKYIARAVGLPYNLKLNDENAPLLATLLMYYGFKISNTCSVPK